MASGTTPAPEVRSGVLTCTFNESFTAQVTAMEFDVAYGSETIKPTLGMVKKGTFNGLMKGISNNNKSLLKINNTGVIS